MTRYFTARGPTRASFVKIELVSTGGLFSTALGARYVDESGDAVGGSITGVSGRDVKVEFVGDAQVRAAQALAKLTHAILRDAAISRIDAPILLRQLAPRVREVDLRANLLRGWADIAALGAGLPFLSVLNVSDNVLPNLTVETASSLTNALPSLRTLVLSETGLDWDSIARVGGLAPNLEELHVASNGISSLVLEPPTRSSVIANESSQSIFTDALPLATFSRLRTLNLSSNPLDSWGHVFALSRLPALTYLLLNGCGITDVWTKAEDASLLNNTNGVESVVAFAALEQLSLTGAALASTAALDAFDAFPSLTALRLTNSDIAAPGLSHLGPVEARQVLIARAPRLTMLSGSEVRAREREDAEKAHALRVAGTWLDEEARTRGVASIGLADIFGARSIPRSPLFSLAPPTTNQTTLVINAPSGTSRGADSGVIMASVSGARDLVNPFLFAPVPLLRVASALEPGAYVAALDPWELGAGDAAAAGRLQRRFPRFFLLAAKYDLLAPSKVVAAGGGSLASSTSSLTLRSMAGGSCTMEPVTRVREGERTQERKVASTRGIKTYLTAREEKVREACLYLSPLPSPLPPFLSVSLFLSLLQLLKI